MTLICPHCHREVFLSLTSGDEPPTEAQLDFIKKLAKERGTVVNAPKTKMEASQIIDNLLKVNMR
jgi:hypothetical protein